MIELLAELGYDAIFREVGWVECLLVRDDEQWLGRGRDRDEALRSAVNQACPSHLARALLARATTIVDEPDVLHPEENEHANGVTASAAEVVDEPIVVAPVDTQPRIAGASEPFNARDRERETALEELRSLLSKIGADEDDLAVCAPQRQRLVLLAWIARARSIQEDFLGDDEVDQVVTNIARAIGTLSKRWWPGSVPALQQAALPADATRALPADDDFEPDSWTEVVERAEQAMRALEHSDAARGFDEYGWADAAACLPAPASPSELLGAVVAELNDVDPDEMKHNDVGRLTRLAQRLRFLRGSITNVRAWSSAMGRLRRIAARDRTVFADLGRALAPSFVPPRPWSAIVDIGTARKPEVDPWLRASEVEGVLTTLPALGDIGALRAWLVRALPLTDTHHEKIATAIRPHTEAIIKFGAEDFAGAGRRIHRRLRKLQEALTGAEPTSAPPSEMSLPSLPVVDDERSDADVVARTRGRRAVFVTNRTDPDLQLRLRDACEFSELDWVASEPRRIDAITDAIMHNRYDVVIAATGFLDHPVDAKLSHACRGAGVPYVRANRGRVGACMRALARDL